MGTLTVRKDQPTTQPTLTTPTRDPLENWMRNVFGWDPFREMQPFLTQAERTFVPAFEIKETKEGYLFKADMPGVKESDIDVMVTGNRLIIKGKRDEEKKQETETYYAYERNYGSFTRTFTLPEGCDGTKAQGELKEGVLTLLVPKTPEAQPKKIDLRATK
jgi:HSP20 family protein